MPSCGRQPLSDVLNSNDSDSDCEMGAVIQGVPHKIPEGPPQPSPPNWTQTAQKLKPRPNRNNGVGLYHGDVVASTSVYGGSAVVWVAREDTIRLGDGMWLVSSLVDFHCHEVANSYIEGGRDRYQDLCVLPSSSWYSCSESNGKYINPPKSNLWETPLQHQYVAFPLNARESHWLLGIFVHASDLLVDVNPTGPVRTSLLILNSIHGFNPPDLQPRYMDFIKLLAMGKALREDALPLVKIFKPEVLQQPNGSDCGVYPGHFLSIFLEDPVKVEAICKGEVNSRATVNKVWQAGRVQATRSNLKALIQAASAIRSASLVYHSGRTPMDLGLDN